MADQASMSRNNGMNHPASPLGVVSNIADFGNDIATLAELQAKLAAYDAKEAASRATFPLILLGSGAVVALASLPVILIGLADLIARWTRISGGMAQLVVGLVSLLLAALACLMGARGSLKSLDSFRRSREELTRNLSWIRTVLIYSGRTGGKRRV
jgi:uncharacterized membrane protein YqjE